MGSWALHLVVPLDNVRVGWRRSLRLTAASLAPKMLRRIAWAAGIFAAGTLVALLGHILICDAGLLAWELSTIWLLLRHSAIVHTALLTCRPCVRNDIVCSALATTLIVGYWTVAIVLIGILEDDVPGVEQAGEEAEAAKSDVDKGFSGAHAALDPYYVAGKYMLLDNRVAQAISDIGAWSGCSRTSDGREQDAEEHQEAVGAAHDYELQK